MGERDKFRVEVILVKEEQFTKSDTEADKCCQNLTRGHLFSSFNKGIESNKKKKTKTQRKWIIIWKMLFLFYEKK